MHPHKHAQLIFEKGRHNSSSTEEGNLFIKIRGFVLWRTLLIRWKDKLHTGGKCLQAACLTKAELSWVLCSVSLGWNHGISQLCSHLGAWVTKNPLPSSCKLLAEFSSLRLCDWGPSFLAGYEPVITHFLGAPLSSLGHVTTSSEPAVGHLPHIETVSNFESLSPGRIQSFQGITWLA